MIRTHRKLWISMALLLIAVLAGIFGLSAVSPALAQQTGIVEKTSDANDGKYKEYTDSKDKFSDLPTYITNDYASKATTELISATPEGVINSVVPTADDPIVNFVPRELFKTVNTTLHIGKNYGFYIDTVDLGTLTETNYAGTPLEYETDGYQSIVMLFTIEVNSDLVDTKSHLIYKISPIF